MNPRLPTREGDFKDVKEDVRTSHFISLLWRQHHEDCSYLFYCGRPRAGRDRLLCQPAYRRCPSRALARGCAADRPNQSPPTSEPPAGLPTAKVERGNLIRTVPAKGTVKLEEVEVGTQMTGMIAYFGPDPDNPSKPLGLRLACSQGHGVGADRPEDLSGPGRLCRSRTDGGQGQLVQLQAKRDQTEAGMEAGQEPAATSRPSPTPITTWPLSNFRMAEANVARERRRSKKRKRRC